MNAMRLALSMLCVAPMLQSCATHPKTPLAWEIAPVMSVRHSTESPDAYYRLGKYYQNQGRHELAIEAFQTVLNADARHVEALNALGTSHAALGLLDLAERAFNEAIAIAPDAAHVHNNLGYAYFLRGNYPLAIGSFEAAAKLDPGNRRTWNNLGMALARAGEQARSAQAFARALEVSPSPVVRTDAAPSTGGNVAPAQGEALASAQAHQRPSLAASEQREALAVPKDRGVIGPAPQAADVTAPGTPAADASRVAAVVQVASSPSPAVEDRAIANVKPQVAARAPVERVEVAAGVPAAAPQPSDVLAVSVAEGVGYAGSTKLIADVAQVEIHQIAPQVFELRASDAAPSLVAPSLVADLPNRFGELQQMARSQGRLELAIAVDEMPAAAPSSSRSAAPSRVAVVSEQAVKSLQRERNGSVSTLVASNSGKPKPSEFYQTVQASRQGNYRAMRFFRLELANGIGIKGFARRMNSLLVAKGAPSSVLSDQRPFKQVRTEIHYRDGYASVANALSHRMTIRPAIVKANGLPMRADVRIVLGRDLVRHVAARDASDAEFLLSDAALRAVLAEVFKG